MAEYSGLLSDGIVSKPVDGLDPNELVILPSIPIMGLISHPKPKLYKDFSRVF